MLTEAILNGQQPVGLDLARLLKLLPVEWNRQSWSDSPAHRQTQRLGYRDPFNAARGLAAIALRGLPERAGQLPVLRFITPLDGCVTNNVV